MATTTQQLNRLPIELQCEIYRWVSKLDLSILCEIRNRYLWKEHQYPYCVKFKLNEEFSLVLTFRSIVSAHAYHMNGYEARGIKYEDPDFPWHLVVEENDTALYQNIIGNSW